MRLNQTPQTLTATEERQVRDQITALKAKLPPREPESREPCHAVVVKTFLDGANHTRPVDLNNEWSRVGHGIREAIKQGGEVVVRPLYPGEVVQEQKYYPGRERLKELEAFLGDLVTTVSRVHGAGDLYELTDKARELVAKRPGA